MNKLSQNSLLVYIYNPIEDEWDYISSFPKNEQKKLIHNSNRFADSYLFANSFLPTFTFISPIKISNSFKDYFEVLSDTQCTLISPKETTPFICENIILDKELFKKLVTESKKRESLTIYSYATTDQLFNLKKKLELFGINVFLPEAPEEKYFWTIPHFGSKSGFRKSFSSLMPSGVIETDYKKAINTAVNIYTSSPGVVIKTDKGSAGQGVYIYKKKPQKTPKKLLIELKKLFKKESWLKKHPIIIEKYIDTSSEKKSPYPSIEFLIHQNGLAEMQYYCNMIVTSEGEFYGMEMHEDVFSKKIRSKVFILANQVVKKYKTNGFRGRFDIDMVSDGKDVFASESNIRTTGGTDTYYMAKKLIGKDFFSKRYILSSYVDLPKSSPLTFDEVKKICDPLLFNKKTKIGILINSESVIKNNGFSYTIIEKNKKKSHVLHEKLKIILTNYKKKQ